MAWKGGANTKGGTLQEGKTLKLEIPVCTVLVSTCGPSALITSRPAGLEGKRISSLANEEGFKQN